MRRVEGEHAETRPGGQCEAALRGIARHLLVPRDAALEAERGCRGVLLDPLRGALGQREHEDDRENDDHDGGGDRGGAAPGDGADGDGHCGGQCEEGSRAEHDPKSGTAQEAGPGQPPGRRIAVGAQEVLGQRQVDRRRDQPQREGDHRAHDHLGRQHPAAAGAGRQRGADQTPSVLGGDEERGHGDHDDQRHDQADEAVAQRVLGWQIGSDVAGAGDAERAGGLAVTPAPWLLPGLEVTGGPQCRGPTWLPRH